MQLDMMLVLQFIAAVATILAIWVAQIIFQTWTLEKRFNKVPHTKLEGIFGSTELLSVDPNRSYRLFLRWADELGGLYWFRALGRVVFVVTEPSIVSQLTARNSPYDKNSEAYAPFTKLTSNTHLNMVSMPTDESWRVFRKAVAPTFNMRRTKATVPFVVERAQVVSSLLLQGGPRLPVDLDDMLQRMNIEVISKFGFDREIDCLKGETGDRLLHEMKLALDEAERMWTVPFREYQIWKKDYWEARRAFAYSQRFARDLLRWCRERHSGGELDPQCIAAALLEARDPGTGRALEDESLVSTIGVLFFAGFETTAHTTFWTIYLLSQHPAYEAKVLDELDGLGLLATDERPHPRDVTYDDVSSMKYMAAAIKESMRLFPVVGNGTIREPSCDVKINGVTFPKGTAFWVPFYAMFRSSRNFERAQEFVPERWMTEQDPGSKGGTVDQQTQDAVASNNIVASSHVSLEWKEGTVEQQDSRPKSFIPFSDGARDCVGRQLAQMTVPVTLAVLLSKFKFRMAEEIPSEDIAVMRVTLQPCARAKIMACPRVPS